MKGYLMKTALMVVGTEETTNIGDYIQALAASQFFKNIDIYIERESINQYNGPPVKMILNGYFMHHPENWPPSSLINPLFISFHINTSVEKELLTDENISYLQKYQPIGCRDINTQNMLRNKNINAYFSSCLTLTLGKKYYTNEKNDICYFVDPPLRYKWNIFKLLSSALYLMAHYKTVKKISIKYFGKNNLNIKKYLNISRFYKMYSIIFDKNMLSDAEYINHQNREIHIKYPTDESKLKYAQHLVESYARASLVITSRIHCALPCLGLDTPVIYLDDINTNQADRCRLDGLKDFFTIIVDDGNKLKPQFEKHGLIDKNNHPENKKNHLNYINYLDESCMNFIYPPLPQ
jgi:hypothetical protein